MSDTINYLVDPENNSEVEEDIIAVFSLLELREILEDYRNMETIYAFVETGHYIDQHLDQRFFLGNLTLEFEEGTILSWTLDESRSGIQNNRPGAFTHIIGNGLIIEGFNIGTGNGVGTSAGLVIVEDVVIRDVLDGLSAHRDGRIEAYRVTVTEAHKFAVAHVNDSSSYQENSFFQPSNNAVGIAFFDTGKEHIFVNSTLLPSQDGQVNTIKNNVEGDNNVIFHNSILGNEEYSIELIGGFQFFGGYVNAVVRNGGLVQINTFTENDLIFEGGELDDLLETGNFNDSLFGHEGNDTLIGNEGGDYIAGGDGNDLLIGD